MEGIPQMFMSSARVNTLLSQVTETPDMATALLQALSKHIHGKTELLKQRIREYESKWKMPFEEFSERTKSGKLVKHAYAGDIEQDFSAWEQAVMLLKHYRSLQIR